MPEDRPRSPGRRRATLRTKLLLSVGSVLVTIGLLEAGLWLLWPHPPVPSPVVHRFLPSWTAIGPAPRTLRVDPGPLSGVTPGPVDNVFNSYGYLFSEERRQRASDDEVRVAVVGGSTVECSMLQPDRRWSAVLERLLAERLGRPVAVLNLGISAQDTRTHLATTAHMVTGLDVDVCVYMIGTNDLGTITSSVHPMLLSDAFLPKRRWSRLLKDLLRQTQISRHLHHLRSGGGDGRGGDGDLPYFHAAAALQRSLPLAPEPVVANEAGLANYARNVVSLAGLCKEHGVVPVFTTQPSMFPPEPTAEQRLAYWGCHDGIHRITAENFTALLRTVNERLQRTCTARSYPCIDLDAAVPKGLGHFYDQVHFNEAGAVRVAEALVEPVVALLE